MRAGGRLHFVNSLHLYAAPIPEMLSSNPGRRTTTMNGLAAFLTNGAIMPEDKAAGA
jgi:hypothetical protein